LLAALGRANANWTAYAFVAACLLVAAVTRERWLRRIVATHIWVGPVIYGAILLTVHWPVLPGLPHALERLSGWRPVGMAVADGLARSGPGTRLLTFDRSLTALLLYYAEVPPGGYAVWNPARVPDNEYDLVASLKPGDRGPLLLVSAWPGYAEQAILP